MMKPMGRQKVRFPNKDGRNPGKGRVMWWEEELSAPCKRRERQQTKRDIEQEINLTNKLEQET